MLSKMTISTTVKAHEINSGVTLNKLVLTYDSVAGYSVLLDEVVPQEPVTPEV